jgi:phosphoenolpyruvate carboxylase
VKKTIKLIKQEAPKREVQHVDAADIQGLREICAIFTKHWQSTIESLAESINQIAGLVPSRRERLLHIGLFGYSRGVGDVTLPRAIKFTASLYSQGIPPELISTGRGLKEATEKGLLPLIEKYYPALRNDLMHAGKYLNYENVHIGAKTSDTFKEIEKDLKAIEEYLGEPLGPKKPHHVIHRNLTSNIFHRMREDSIDKERITEDIIEAAIIRRSIG